MKIDITDRLNSNGFYVIFWGFREDYVKKIKNIAMAILIEERFLPQPSGINKRKGENGEEELFFEVIPQKPLSSKILFGIIGSALSATEKSERKF